MPKVVDVDATFSRYLLRRAEQGPQYAEAYSRLSPDQQLRERQRAAIRCLVAHSVLVYETRQLADSVKQLRSRLEAFEQTFSTDDLTHELGNAGLDFDAASGPDDLHPAEDFEFYFARLPRAIVLLEAVEELLNEHPVPECREDALNLPRVVWKIVPVIPVAAETPVSDAA